MNINQLKLTMLCLFVAAYGNYFSQCTNATPYGTQTAPTGGGSVTQSCMYAGEYMTLNSVAAATDYIASSANASDILTIHQGTPGGPVIAFGATPLNWTSTVASTYYVHVNTAGCGSESACRDLTITHVPSPMTYVSSTTFQASTSDVENCSSMEQIIGIEVVTSGATSPLDLTELIIATDGSTAPLMDIGNISIYYTGTSATFSTSNLFGTSAPAPTGTNITVGGTQTLSAGTNYFWVAYDINLMSVVGDVVDGVCSQITVDGSNETPSATNPGGSRTIIDCTRACPTSATVHSEFFETDPSGVISGTIYGGGTHNDAGSLISGTRHGWFNLVNGVGNVDVLDQQIDGLFVGCETTVTYWAKKTYNTTSVEFNMYDDNGAILAQNIQADLSATYVQFSHTFTATTPGMRFVLHFNSTGGSGVDVAMENIVVTQCCDMPVLLPVELSAFEGYCNGNDNVLTWTTASENNSDYFDLERTYDGSNWESIHTVEAAGYSNTSINYSYTDRNASTAIYRLKQVDNDGTIHYPDMVAVDRSHCKGTGSFELYPNPANSTLNIVSNETTERELIIFNSLGKVVYTADLSNQLLLNVGYWAGGVYMIQLGNEVKKLVVQHN